jgi:hypothetical protein
MEIKNMETKSDNQLPQEEVPTPEMLAAYLYAKRRLRELGEQIRKVREIHAVCIENA